MEHWRPCPTNCTVSGFAGLAMAESKGNTDQKPKRTKKDKPPAEKASKAPKTPRAPRRDKDKAADLERASEWRKKLRLMNIFAGTTQRGDLYHAKRFVTMLDKNDPAEALLLDDCVKLANAAIMLWPAEYAKLPIEQLTATCLQISAATRVTVTKTQGPPLIDLQKCVPSLTLSYGLFQIQIFIEFVSFRFDSRLRLLTLDHSVLG